MVSRLAPMGVEAVIKGLPSYLRGMDQMGTATSRTSGLLGKIGGIATTGFKALTVGATAAVGAIGAVGGAMLKLASDAAPIEGIGKAFEGLTADFEGGSEAMLKALQDASYGMTTNTELMKTFNLGAQLVSQDFAKQLPDAMQYLGKVSLATGQDMGFLLDSLVRGVGRLSPMILDNLAIQVDLTSAYEEWAKVNGTTVDEMSKTEQQAAVMAQVMSKLEENTATMPDVAGSAQQSFAKFGVQLKNFKDELGLAVLPIASTFMGFLSRIAEKVLPKIVKAFEGFADILDIVGKYIGIVLDDGDYLNDWLTHLPKPLQPIIKNFGKFIDTISVIGKYMGIVLEDGDTLNDWLTHLPEPLRPLIRRLGDFAVAVKKLLTGEFSLKEVVPPWLINIWEEFKKAVGTVADVIGELASHIVPWVVQQFNKITAWFEENETDIINAIQNIADFFKNTLGPAVINLWDNVLAPFGDDFIDLILGIGDVILDVFSDAAGSPFDKLSETLDNFFMEDLPKIFEAFFDWVLDFFGLQNWQTVLDQWQWIMDAMGIIVDTFVQRVISTIEDIKAYLFGQMGEFGFSRGGAPVPAPANVHPAPTFPSSSQSTTSNYNLTINTSAPQEDILADYRMLQAMGGRQ